MAYLSFFMTLTLFFTQLSADDFAKLNPALTKQMKEHQTNATICSNPATPKENFSTTFRYGCFCGKGYPDIQHSSDKPYRYLKQTQREELIAKYYSIKPYDSIDEACMQHDICYINKGREDQRCNDALYTNLREIEEIFDIKKNNSPEKRCKVLASDMAAVFRTIFATGDNISKIRLGMLAITTPLTVASKTLQKTSRTLHEGATYPLAGEQCIVDSMVK